MDDNPPSQLYDGLEERLSEHWFRDKLADAKRLAAEFKQGLADARKRLDRIKLDTLPEHTVDALDAGVAADAERLADELKAAEEMMQRVVDFAQTAKGTVKAKTDELAALVGTDSPSLTLLRQLNESLDARSRMMVIRLAFAEVRREPQAFWDLCQGEHAVLLDDFAQLEALKAAEAESPLKQLQQEFSDYKVVATQMIEASSAKASALTEQLADLQEKQRREATPPNVQDTLAAMREERDQANARLSLLERELADEKAELQQASDDLEFANRDREILGDKLDDAEHRAHRLDAELATVKAHAHSSQELNVLEARIVELEVSESELEEARAQQALMSSRNQQLQSEKAALTRDLKEQRQLTQQSVQSFEVVNNARDELSRSNAGLSAEVRDLRARLSKSEAERQTLINLKDVSASTLDSLRKKMREMVAQHKTDTARAEVQHRTQLDGATEKYNLRLERVASATTGLTPLADVWVRAAEDLASSPSVSAAGAAVPIWQMQMAECVGSADGSAVQLAAATSLFEDLSPVMMRLAMQLSSAPAVRTTFVAQTLLQAIGQASSLQCRMAAGQAVALLERRWSMSLAGHRERLEAGCPAVFQPVLFLLPGDIETVQQVVRSSGAMMGSVGALAEPGLLEIALFDFERRQIQIASLDDISMAYLDASLSVKGHAEKLPLTPAQVRWWTAVRMGRPL